MRVRFLDRFDYVTLRSANGTARATVAYRAGDEPITVPRAHGEAAVAAGKAVDVDEPAVRSDDSAEIIGGVIARQIKGRSRVSRP